MGKIKRIKIKSNRKFIEPGISPGLIRLSENALKPKITVYSYNAEKYITEEIANTHELELHLSQYASLTHWVDIRGLGDAKMLEYIGKKHKIHQLVLEDIVDTHQRPKLDEYDDYLFSTSRKLYLNQQLEVENEQMSFLLMPKVLISFQENYSSCTAPVIQRLKGGKGNIRSSGPSYMMYALMDVIIDEYFTLMNKLGEELETIEELLNHRPDKTVMFQAQVIKRAMIMIRRAAWPERDKINDMLRSSSPLITTETKTFLRDTYDHSMQVIDLVESSKDIATGLIEMNLSIVSNRMNEIMKVLTIISSIFIPLTFIAGVYGMNFAYNDPETGKILHHNMPELYAENGYSYTLAVMLIIALLQLVYFWRRGWLK